MYQLKTEILYGMGRKKCGKRRKCWLPTFSPFPTMFSKGFFFRVVKSRYYVERVKTKKNHFCPIEILCRWHIKCYSNMNSVIDKSRKHKGKGENTMFLTLSETSPGFYMSAVQVL